MAVTPLRQVATGILLAAANMLAGCDAHFADVIGRTEVHDPCSLLSATECPLDTANGCSLQPNPTGCTSNDPACVVGVCRGGDPFVRRSGEALFLHGAPFEFVGVVSWWLAWQDNGCRLTSYPTQQVALDASFDQLATMHTTVMRFWAFQGYAGKSGTDYSHFDRIVTRARAAGVRLLPVLENMRSDCTSGSRDDAWFSTGYKSPYGSYALSYRDYVAGLVDHFRNEPTIIGWELMHEASSGQFAALDGFASDMATLVRATDPNHLIALGANDGSSSATSTSGDSSNFYKLNNHTEIDLIDVHDFDMPDEVVPSHVERARVIARSLVKPIFQGAVGVKPTETSATALAARAEQIRLKLQAAQNNGFSGFLVYDFLPGWSSAFYDFDARAGEPLVGPNGVLDRSSPRF